MIDDTLLESEERMTQSVEYAREDLTTIRTGRANPSSLTEFKPSITG